MKKAMENNKMIDLNRLSINEVKAMKSDSHYSCPYCLEPVRLKRGEKRKAHFAHISNCPYEYYTNESEEHGLAKNQLADWLQRQEIQSSIEYPLKKIHRVADIFFQWEGRKYAIEIQKSPLSEQMFLKRTKDYESLEVSIIWIFIGNLIKRENSFILNRVMVLNKNYPMIHFNLDTQIFTVFSQVFWISTKEIQAQYQRYLLDKITFRQLIMLPKKKAIISQKEWLGIKTDFRKYKWQAYLKYDRRLQQMCAKNYSNLSLLPAEIGWPIAGSGFRKSIFIWQAYILMNMIMSYEIGDFFTLGDMVRKLKFWPRMEITLECLSQLKAYLDVLVQFKILNFENNYYEYKKAPIFHKRLEDVLIEDEKLSLTFFQD